MVLLMILPGKEKLPKVRSEAPCTWHAISIKTGRCTKNYLQILSNHIILLSPKTYFAKRFLLSFGNWKRNIMYEHIEGKITEINPTYVILENSGIGYFINISLTTFSNIQSSKSIKLFIHLVIREDAHLLYGFYSKFEREIFRMLISVSGKFLSLQGLRLIMQ